VKIHDLFHDHCHTEKSVKIHKSFILLKISEISLESSIFSPNQSDISLIFSFFIIFYIFFPLNFPGHDSHLMINEISLVLAKRFH